MTAIDPADERRSPRLGNGLRRFYLRRRYRIHLDAWGICIGLIAAWQLLMFVIFPTSIQVSSVTSVIGEAWAYVWATGYAVAGLCMVYGLLKPDSGIDAFGLAVLAGAIAGQLACIVVVHPDNLLAATPQLVAPMFAALMRFRIVTGRVQRVPDDIPPWP